MCNCGTMCNCDHSDVTVKNAVKKYLIAKKDGKEAKKTAAFEFICQNFEKVSDQSDFKELLNRDHLEKIIASPQLVASIRLLFSAVVNWADVDFQWRSHDLEVLLKKIPFAAAHKGDEDRFLSNPVIRSSSRLKHLVRELWAKADSQRVMPSDADDNVWYADITKMLKWPVKADERSFFFVRQGYIFEVQVSTHSHFILNDKGLDVFLRVRHADSGWLHSTRPLRALEVNAAFWVLAGCMEHCVDKKTCCIDLMKEKDTDWFGFQDLVSSTDLADIVNSDKVLLKIRLDIHEIGTAGPHNKVSGYCNCCKSTEIHCTCSSSHEKSKCHYWPEPDHCKPSCCCSKCKKKSTSCHKTERIVIVCEPESSSRCKSSCCCSKCEEKRTCKKAETVCCFCKVRSSHCKCRSSHESSKKPKDKCSSAKKEQKHCKKVCVEVCKKKDDHKSKWSCRV